MKSEDLFRKEIDSPEKDPKKKESKKRKTKVLQEPKVSEVARLRASIAAERNSNVKTK